MNAYPWFSRWELHYYKGMDYSESGIPAKRERLINHPMNVRPWEEYDLMKWYRQGIDDDTVDHVMRHVQDGVERNERAEREREEEEEGGRASL